MQEDFEIWVEDLLDEGYDLSEYTWDEMADAYLNLEEARQLRPASERMARTMTPSDRREQERKRALRDAGQQALADIRALAKGKSSKTQSQNSQSTPDSVVRKLPKGQKVDKLAMAAKKAMGEEIEEVDEATAMAKRGYDETKLRRRVGGGQAADRATALASKETYGDSNKKEAREKLARAQR